MGFWEGTNLQILMDIMKLTSEYQQTTKSKNVSSVEHWINMNNGHFTTPFLNKPTYSLQTTVSVHLPVTIYNFQAISAGFRVISARTYTAISWPGCIPKN